MPLENRPNDDFSIRSEGGRGIFSRNRSKSRGRMSSAQSVASHASSRANRGRSKSGFFRGIRGSSRLRNRNSVALDDVSVSDSLCSGVLRGDIGGSYNTAGSCGDSVNTENMSKKFMTKSKSFMEGKVASNRPSTRSVEPRGRSNSLSLKETPPVTGGVSNLKGSFKKRPSLDNSVRSDLSGGTGPSLGVGSATRSMSDFMVDGSSKREARKERVKEKLERYKRDQKQLRHSCVALEQQLAQTTEKLKEVDSKAAFKIDSLEAELRETRGGLERVARESTKEVSDQGEVIKTLGKKLIRQAHVIKKQKTVVEQYKVKIQQLQEEMNMQDERDTQRAEEYCQLKDQFDNVSEQKTQMQNMLQENIEEMMDLKNETEKDAKSLMELKFDLQQKEAKLERAEREKAESMQKISAMEIELEEKTMEVEDLREKIKASESSMAAVKTELEKMEKEVEGLQSTQKNNNGGGCEETVQGGLREEEGGNHVASVPIRAHRTPSTILRGWNRGDILDADTFEDELQAKDLTIQRLDEAVTEHEETIQTLRSDMVKMSSTYKQDSYLKRKEIAKLKQMNAEYALKLRALEKAFKSIGGRNSDITTSMHGMSASSHRSMAGDSRHGRSLHGSNRVMATKESKEAAVKARLGGVAPYQFPRSDDLRRSTNSEGSKEAPIVINSNFFVDASEAGSEEGRKGEFPEEC